MVRRVLVCGPSQSGRATLCRTLAGAFADESRCEVSDVEFAAWDCGIRTKYYDVQLELLRPLDETAVLMSAPSAASLDAEAIILVVDACCPDVSGELAQWSSFLRGFDVPVKLCVLSHWDACAEAGDGLRPQWVEWGLDHQTEVVAANLLAPGEGAGDRNKTGVPRLVQALQSHVWSSAVMRTAATPARPEQVVRMVPPQDEAKSSGSEAKEPEGALPLVLFVGAAQTGKASLAAQLLSAGEVTGVSASMWALRTRYFTAQVEVQLVQALEAGDERLARCEAAVMCFDLSREETFAELEPWAAALSGAAVKLCVGSRADSAGEGEQYGAHVMWCLDREVEYVEADCTRLGDVEARDKEGVPRVLEALLSHAWSNARFTTPARPTSEGLVVPDADGASEELEAGASAPTPAPSPTEPAPPQAMAASKQSVGAAGSLGSPAACAACGKAPPAGAKLLRCGRCRRAFYCNEGCQTTHWAQHRGQCRRFAAAGSAEPAEPEEDADAKAMRQVMALDGMVDKVREVRARAADMSDEQRREMAAKTAEQLWQLMGGSDSESES